MRSTMLYGRFQDRPSPIEAMMVPVKNAESSASIPLGSPVCLVLNGTNDGLAVVLPSTGGAIKAHSLFYGIASEVITAGAYGETVISGFNNYVRILRQTRAASTDAWASVAAIAVGECLNVDTVNNVMVRSASIAASAFLPICIAAETIASATTLASTSFTTGDTRTAITSAMKAFLRAM